jgi:hypothetical protein
VDTRSPQLLVVQISNVWLWTPMRDSHLDMPVLALDEAGREYFGTMPRTPDLARWIAQRFSTLQPDEDGHYPNGDLSWNAQGGAWVGAMAALEVPSLTSAVRIGIITGGADRPWSVAFASALRTQSALLVAVLVLAALAGEAAGRFYLPAFRQLRRSLSSLPNRITPLAPDARLCREFSQVVDAFNRSAQVIGAQRESSDALEEIDGLLLMGGDYEASSTGADACARPRREQRGPDAGGSGQTGHGLFCRRCRWRLPGESRGARRGDDSGAARVDHGSYHRAAGRAAQLPDAAAAGSSSFSGCGRCWSIRAVGRAVGYRGAAQRRVAAAARSRQRWHRCRAPRGRQAVSPVHFDR